MLDAATSENQTVQILAIGQGLAYLFDHHVLFFGLVVLHGTPALQSGGVHTGPVRWQRLQLMLDIHLHYDWQPNINAEVLTLP